MAIATADTAAGPRKTWSRYRHPEATIRFAVILGVLAFLGWSVAFLNIDLSRLLGAFNFDSLVRRLELDFSDLYQRGFAFDTIRGQLGFTDGVVRFNTPLVIDGPSSRISIEGEINLPRETIAADMQVRIPLGENISMLAGLLGAWPIALSTYLASKIFADQVEDFTTILYRLDGPWSNPQAGFAPPEEVEVAPAAP